jgi:hypothetical protein
MTPSTRSSGDDAPYCASMKASVQAQGMVADLASTTRETEERTTQWQDR